MKLIYVAGPYRSKLGVHGIVENIRAAEQAALQLWRMGYAVICPHKNTALFDGAAPDDVWLKGDIVMLLRCDAVYCLPTWESSTGAQGEVKAAEGAGIPVLFSMESCRAFLEK